MPPRLPVARLTIAALAVIIAGVSLRVLLVEDPEGGRPAAEVAINSTRPDNLLATEHAQSPVADAPAMITLAPETPAGEAAGPAITTVDDSLPSGPDMPPPPGEPDERGVFPDLVDETRYGAVPRTGPQGTTPFAAYARPSISPETAGGSPLVAVIVTGLGLNEAGTLQAIDALPDNVTLGFAPYGKTLAQTSAFARSQGHELYIEVPLEPFDYPANDPGPETLLTGQPPRANIDKLYWLMARFGGYAGLINNMGARFTASAADFGPVMEELGTRGLGYIDDGSSNRSLAEQLANKNKVPFTRADITLDTNPARAHILSALDALEARARETGSAVGIASALPVSIRAIAEWAQQLEDRGVMLVPASALMKQ